MSLSTAQAFAWSLATSLMVSVILFKTTEGFGVMPSVEFDGHPDTIVREYDPYSS